MYKVIKFFTDLQDNRHPYNVGDVYPREGVTVSQKRLDELASDKNRQKTPLIKKVDDEPQLENFTTEFESEPEPTSKPMPVESKKKKSRSK